jgi:hypothetical protein
LFNQELSEKERKEVELLFERVFDLQGNDKLFFNLQIRSKVKSNFGTDITKFNTQNMNNINSSVNFWPPNNPKWFKMDLSSASSSRAAQSGGQAAGSKSAEPEVKAPVKEVYFSKEIESSF